MNINLQPEDVFLKEAKCAKRLDVCLNTLRDWNINGDISSCSPNGSRVKLYYWPQVVGVMLGTGNPIYEEVKPVGKLH